MISSPRRKITRKLPFGNSSLEKGDEGSSRQTKQTQAGLLPSSCSFPFSLLFPTLIAAMSRAKLNTLSARFSVRFLLVPLLVVFCTGATANAQESTISLQHVLTAAREYFSKNNLDTNRYYLTAIEKKFRVTTSVRSKKSRTEEYYELWWVRAGKRESRYLGLKVPANGRIQRLRSSASPQRNNEYGKTPTVSLQKALRLSEAYLLKQSLTTSTQELHSASLVAAGRSPRNIYWCVRLRDRKGMEGDDILLAVRMDGTVERLHLT
jgi:hypothetical protein